MRTITGPQRTQIAAGTLAIFSKLEIQNPDLAWVDVSTSLSTPDWFNEATLSESIDQVSQSFTAVLLRDAGSLSLAPLRTDSTINRNSVPAYAPMLDVRRMWRVSIAVIAQGSTPISTDWKEVGKGYIDTIDVQGSPSTITITGRDLLAQILDHYMRGVDGITPFPPYSPSGTDSMETVIQQILDDELGTGRANVGSSGITLYTPVSPSYVMKPYTTGAGGLMDALTKVAQLAGMVLRYRYDASDVLRLTLLKPPRTATVADWTIGKDEYSVIPINKLDITGVRTYIDLFYIDSTLGKQHVISPKALTGTLTATSGSATFSTSQAGIVANGSVILVAGNTCVVSAFNGTTGCTLSGTPTFAASPWTTSASLTKYGVRYMKVDLSGSLPMTATNAQAMVDAIRSDLETPWLEQQFTSYGLWFAQLYDYAKTLANGVQYNTDQLGGVTTISHAIRGGTVKTTIGARGQPSGGYRLWTATGLTPPDAATLNVVATPGTTSYSIAWSGTGVLVSIGGATPVPPSASPITVTRNASGGADQVYAFTGTANGKTVSNTVTIPAQSGSTAPSASLIPSLTNNQIDDTTSPVTLTASASNLPAAYTWAIYQGYSKGQYSATASWSGSNASNPLTQTESVTPSVKNAKWFKLVVTVGADTYVAETQVQGLWAFLNPATGQASSGAQDSAGRTINRMFAKPIFSDPDTMAGVPDDVPANRYAVTVNQQSGANRAYVGLDSSSLLVTGVGPGATVAGISAASLSRAQGTGVFSETFSDPGARNNWSVVSGGVEPYIVNETASGLPAGFGPNCFAVVSPTWLVWVHPIPFDPTKLYKMTTRVSTGSYGGGVASQFIAGFVFYKGDGVTVINKVGANAYTNLHYFNVFTSLAYTSNVWETFIGYMYGVGTPIDNANDSTNPSGAPSDAVYFAPIFICNFGGTSTAQMNVDSIEVTEYDPGATQRAYGAIGADANLQQQTLATNGSDTRVIAAGQIRKVGLVNSGSVSFTGTVVNSPTGIVTGGVSYEPSSVWGTQVQADGNAGAGGLAPLTTRQIDECYLYNVTTSGCNVRARLRQVGGSLTARSDTSWSPSSLTTNGSSSVVTSANAPAYDDSYTANFSFNFQHGGGLPKASSISVVVSLDYYNGSSWTSTSTVTFSASDPGTTSGGSGTSTASGTFALVGSVAGRISTSQFRLTILSVSFTGGGSTTLSLTPGSLAYSTSGADQYATKTPTGVTCVVDIVGAS